MGEDNVIGTGTEHVITRTVRDTAAVLDATGAPPPSELFYAPPPPEGFLSLMERSPGRLRVGMARSHPAVELHPEAVAAVDRAAAVLESLGHEVADDRQRPRLADRRRRRLSHRGARAAARNPRHPRPQRRPLRPAGFR